MRGYGTFKKSKDLEERKEKFLEYLKSLAVETDEGRFLPSVATIDTYQNPSSAILKKLRKEGKIIPLGRKAELKSDLTEKIREKLETEPEKKEQWWWENFFKNPTRVKKEARIRCFINTSFLYRII
ncbi:MAG: hypothetical protein A3I88_02725 [Candidatus Portnoybacteria bacterium RIFCSPLOWO2_12_FULL_39_9]|uniref:Uncharacterized protein n=1 Tax=Candidatus Portnoybacteria bacterium RIFCSPHIGHO2_12_FULL_38_9 TaxID=1801997 RepID=A0A1G2FF51_9BACT|nr:MAG: hypothetical protein A3H00_01965 [Candidatus Portnoybacteria bacterium RBG_13_40_8]OGZ36112.1 MAG: hypothetical protein A2646_02655 [Candidatus Portnoybacteria bacterium RIFCSPHIGHO2_02_FULL_39_12]OGZ36706.1 MAG: hypothetical protein A3J64_00310 [Candidatus Portnoybacteria bacterium RIFCSPHIGHO2_12_FULL_38_9]OGZ38465.1 MAG: hypothetical protein A3F21_02595 [Candidatus Portnoybacteria bacterium RIFCSPLOWO2_01_FULL_38_39]OGZ40364.1 MAG: hypothetical protein A3I88_02725 [Candidatus Portnoy